MKILDIHFRHTTRLTGVERPRLLALFETDRGWYLVDDDPTDLDVDDPRTAPSNPLLYRLGGSVGPDLTKQVTPEGWKFNDEDRTLWDWLYERDVEALGAVADHPWAAALAVALFADTAPAPPVAFVPVKETMLARIYRRLSRFGRDPSPDPGYWGGIRRVENPCGATDIVVVTAINAQTGVETDLAVAAPPRAK